MADVIACLSSDSARWITGARVLVDGIETLRGRSIAPCVTSAILHDHITAFEVNGAVCVQLFYSSGGAQLLVYGFGFLCLAA